MTTQDTTPAEYEVDGFVVGELVDDDQGVADGNPFGPLGALLGGFDPAAMLRSMGVELPDPDAATLDDVLDELAELRACVDWIAAALIGVAAKVPAKWRPTLGEYPPPVVVED